MLGQSKVLSDINEPREIFSRFEPLFIEPRWIETDTTESKIRLIKLIPECCIQVIFGHIVGAIIHFSSSSLESSILSLFTVSTN